MSASGTSNFASSNVECGDEIARVVSCVVAQDGVVALVRLGAVGIVVDMAGERQRRGIRRIRELRLVTVEAGEIDGAADHQKQRDAGCSEEDGDVAGFVAPKPA